MWYLGILAAAVAPTVLQEGLMLEGIAFGSRQTLSCTWFTNFENSGLEKCRRGDRDALPANEEASIKCLRGACEQLDAEARRIARWRKPEPPWGTFTITFVERVSVERRQKRYIGDGTRTVLIEKLLNVRKAA